MLDVRSSIGRVIRPVSALILLLYSSRISLFPINGLLKLLVFESYMNLLIPGTGFALVNCDWSYFVRFHTLLAFPQQFRSGLR